MDIIGNNVKNGNLHLIMGPMYSGKSSHLIQNFNELSLINQNVLVVTHTIETRYSIDNLSSHDRKEVACKKVNDIQSVITLCNSDIKNDVQLAEYILVDEAQFFPDLLKIIELVETYNKTVYVYGLDGDFKRNKFGSILDLIPFCNTVKKLNGTCSRCENSSLFSWRISHDKMTQVVVGAADEYIPLCRQCYLKVSLT